MLFLLFKPPSLFEANCIFIHLIGRKGLISTVDYAMGISTAIVQGLSEIPSIKLLSPEQGSYMVRFGYRGPPFLLKKGKESTHSAPEEPTQYLPVEVG